MNDVLMNGQTRFSYLNYLKWVGVFFIKLSYKFLGRCAAPNFSAKHCVAPTHPCRSLAELRHLKIRLRTKTKINPKFSLFTFLAPVKGSMRETSPIC